MNITNADQDSDSIYVTNQKDIAEYAKICYKTYPTIVNNIPKEKNTYSNTLLNFSKIDNNLSAASRAIGESSNLAQIALTYTYNFKEQKYIDYVCILSVLAQVAIDNAKRRFDIDLTSEIKRIKNNMNIDKNKYPIFWKLIRKDFNVNRINKKLQCPMNYLYDLKIESFKSETTTLPMSDFFIKHDLEASKRRTCKKVEELIQKYSLQNYNVRNSNEDGLDVVEDEDYLLLRSDFENLVEDLRKTNISRNYVGFMSWLIDRAFIISPHAKTNKNRINSVLNKNKSLFLKTLYDINAKSFLKCFKTI